MKADLPYVRRKRKLLFWEPTKAMRDVGFRPKPLGPDSAEARAEAARLYAAWQAERVRDKLATSYPNGTLGAFWELYHHSVAWGKKAPRTREEYERTWKHIEPEFGRKLLTKISVDDVERFADALEVRVSHSERHRTIKNLRALYGEAIQRLRLSIPNPARGMRNSQPKGRNSIWFGAEIAKLVKAADEMKQPGMALAITVAWECMFSPVDVWTLTRDCLRDDGDGWYLATDRKKTGREAFGALSQATAERLLAYVESIGAKPGEKIIRRHDGKPYENKDLFAKDFRAVRLKAFGKADRRQFLDIRRSANVEADAAGADKETMGQLLANNIASSAFLDATYTPPTVTKAREVAAKRAVGRDKLKVEVDRVNRSNREG